MSAPHLPPKSCSIETHRRVQTLPWFLAVILLSFVSGASAAVMAVAWAVPTFLGDTSIYIRNRSVQETPHTTLMDAVLERQIGQRTAAVFDKRKAVSPTLFTDAARIGTLALLSSDGWGVMYDPAYQPGQEQYWHIVDMQNTVVPVEKVTYNKESKLVYVKLRGTGFQVFSFAEWGAVEPGMEVWVSDQKRWQKKIIDQPYEILHDSPIGPHTVVSTFTVLPQPQRAGMVLTDQGQLIGFVTQQGQMIPEYLISSQLPQVLADGRAETRTLLLTGQYVSYEILGAEAVATPGFYVSQVSSAALKKIVQPGDILVKVNGQTASTQLLPQVILHASSPIMLDIIRKGTLLQQIAVSKEAL